MVMVSDVAAAGRDMRDSPADERPIVASSTLFLRVLQLYAEMVPVQM